MKKILLLFVVIMWAQSATTASGQVYPPYPSYLAIESIQSPTGKTIWGVLDVDSNNNEYIGGSFNGTIILGSDTLITNLEKQFIAKRDSFGNYIWAKALNLNTSFNGAFLQNIKVIGQKIYLSGRDDNTLGFQGYLGVYTINGDSVFDRQGGPALPTDFSVDDNGYIYVCGVYNDCPTCSYIEKISPEGVTVWHYDLPNQAILNNILIKNDTVRVFGQYKYQLQVSDIIGTTYPQLTTGDPDGWGLLYAEYSPSGELLSAHSAPKPPYIQTASSSIGLVFSSLILKSGDPVITYPDSMNQYEIRLRTYTHPSFMLDQDKMLGTNMVKNWTSCTSYWPWCTSVLRESKCSNELLMSLIGLSCQGTQIYRINSNYTVTDSVITTTGFQLSATASRDMRVDITGKIHLIDGFKDRFYAFNAGTLDTIWGNQSPSPWTSLFVGKLCPTARPTVTQSGDSLVFAPSGHTYMLYLNGNFYAGPITTNYYVIGDTIPIGIFHVQTIDGLCPQMCADSVLYEYVPSNDTDSTNGITDINGTQIKVYPNPATSKITITGFIGTIHLMDISGKTMIISDIKNEQILDISSLPPGLYFLKIGQRVIKIIKL